MSVDQALKDSQAAVARAVKQAGYPEEVEFFEPRPARVNRREPALLTLHQDL